MESPISTMLRGPQDLPSNQSTLRTSSALDKGKGKMPKYEVNHFDGSDLDVSTCSPNNEFEEFGVPIMRTPGVKTALTATNEKL